MSGRASSKTVRTALMKEAAATLQEVQEAKVPVESELPALPENPTPEELVAALALTRDDVAMLLALSRGEPVSRGQLALAALRTRLEWSQRKPAQFVAVGSVAISVLDPFAVEGQVIAVLPGGEFTPKALPPAPERVVDVDAVEAEPASE